MNDWSGWVRHLLCVMRVFLDVCGKFGKLSSLKVFCVELSCQYVEVLR